MNIVLSRFWVVLTNALDEILAWAKSRSRGYTTTKDVKSGKVRHEIHYTDKDGRKKNIDLNDNTAKDAK